MVDYTINNNIKLVIAAGDMYKNSSVSSNIQTEFNKRMKKLLDNNIKVLMLDGNHDVDKMDTKKSPMVVYDDLGVKNVIQTRFHKEEIVTIDGESVKFVFLPTYHTAEEIENIVNKTKYDKIPIVYIFHSTIKGANLNDWNIAEKETYVEANVFNKKGVAAVVMGHLHKHQVMLKKPLVYYTGSLQRVDFSEEKQKKGFVVLDVNQDSSVDYEFIEIESQKFFTLDVSLVGESSETDYICKQLDKYKDKIKNSIVRIRANIEKGNFINETKVYEYTYSLGAEMVLDIQKRSDKKELVRNASLTEHIDENKALQIYFDGKLNADKFLLMGKKIIEKAKEEGRI
jgi:exonuclease SbcD